MAAKRVLVVAHGSRGDAQPMVAFAKALQDGGFAVRVVTDPDHCDLFSHMGLSVVGSGTYSLTQELREDPGMRSSMESGDFPTFAKALAESNKRNYPESIRISLNEIDTFKPDLITSGALDSVDLLAIATAKGIPYRFSGLQCGYPSMFATSFLGEPESAPGRVHLACGYAMMKLWLKGETEIKVPVLKEQCPEAVQYWPNYNAFVQINAFNSATQPLLFLSSQPEPAQG